MQLNSQKLLFDIRLMDALDKRSIFTFLIRLLWFSSRWFAQTMCEFPRYKPCSEPARARKQNEAAFVEPKWSLRDGLSIHATVGTAGSNWDGSTWTSKKSVISFPIRPKYRLCRWMLETTEFES